MRRKAFFLPSAITAFGLSCGLFAIFRASFIPQGQMTESLLTMLAGVLLIAALADILDGAVARAMKIESEFGGFFDSLADAISFGVAPSLIILKGIPLNSDEHVPFVIMGSAMIFTLCGVLRLVRFNVQMTAAQHDDEVAKVHKKSFTGLPIPAAAAAAFSINLCLYSDDFGSFISDQAKIWILSFQLILLGYLMVSRWKFPSIKTLRVPVGSFQIIFFTVLIALVILYGLLSHFALVLFLFSWGYVAISLILSIVDKIKGKDEGVHESEDDETEDF